MSHLISPRPPIVPFLIDDDSESDSDTQTLTTARSSPTPRGLSSLPSTSSLPYSDDPTLLPPSSPFLRPESASFYPPKPLRSNIPSREAEFDEDDDVLEEDDMDPSEPLLMEGLMQKSAAKRGSLDLRRESRKDEEGEGGDEPPDWLTKGAGVLAGVANMSNSILGAGIIGESKILEYGTGADLKGIGLPYALREAGFVSGIVLLVVLGVVTDWTIRLIVLNAKMSGRKSYIDIMDSCFGPRGRAAVSFFQFSFAFGGMCAFCVILGDTIPHVLQSLAPEDPGAFISFLISRQFVTTLLTVGISYPLSLYRDIEKLSKASALALISMVVIVVSVGVRGPGVEADLKGDPSERWTFIRGGFFEAIGVISFAFVCHHNSLLIYGSLRTPTIDRFARVTHISTALSVLACLCMSTSGFLVFTDRTQGNILNNFAQNDTIINIARACFGANMFATLPLEAFVCREVMETYFWPDEAYNKKRHVVITTSLVAGALLVSLITCDLGLILELAGGFSATALAYIFRAPFFSSPRPSSAVSNRSNEHLPPRAAAACYLHLSGKGAQHRQTRFAAWTCAAFGIVVMVLSTVLSVKKALEGSTHKVC
ncbi:solute carrier family 38 (sodium-coupled neutral amino acid transporter), member 11, partial [Phenoliferia sp. Uapishka_3]